MTPRYEMLERHHFIQYGVDWDDLPTDFVGFAEIRGWDVTAIGFVWLHPHKGAWSMFHTKHPPTRTIHKKALELFEGVAGAGVKEVWAGLDATIPAAKRWLEKLGFEPVAGVTINDQQVWKKWLG